jgi:hypothetical protein
VFTVLAGLALFGGLLLPLAFWALTRRRALDVVRGFSRTLVLAFGTSSSSAALPARPFLLAARAFLDSPALKDPKNLQWGMLCAAHSSCSKKNHILRPSLSCQIVRCMADAWCGSMVKHLNPEGRG